MRRDYLNVPLYIWLGFFLSIPFFYFSNVDLFVSHLFYRDGTFPFNGTSVEKFFYYSIKPLIILALLLPLVATIYNSYYHKNILNMTKRKLLYIFLVISVVPGLVVSFLLKENFERPRPRDVTEFNGTKDFYKAFTITHEGKKSFSSGHVAAAFSLLGLVYLVQRRRAFWFALTLTYALSMMVARVASGAHFLSDVVTSFFIVYIANLILYYYLIEKNKKEENL